MKRRSLSRYRLGLLIALLVSFGLSAAILHQAHLNKENQNIQITADSIENKFSSYAYDKQLVPESLAAAGIKQVPSYITYKKLTRDSYRFCVTYKKLSLGEYPGGKTCHSSTVYLTPPPPPPAFVKNSDGTYTVCGEQAGYYGIEGFVTASAADTPNVININNQAYTFSAGSKAFNEQCNELTQADLHIGDRVDVFSRFAPQNTPIPAISTYLKRS